MSLKDSLLHSIMPHNVTKVCQLLSPNILKQPITGYLQLLPDIIICARDSQNSAVAFVFKCCDFFPVCLPKDPSLTSIRCYWEDTGSEDSELCLLILALPELLHTIQYFQTHGQSTLDFLANITLTLDSCIKIVKIVNLL